MTAYWLAQGVGVIAFLIGITTFFNRDERRFKKQLSVYSAVIGVHFFLLGTYPAGASAILNAIRTLITLRTRSLWVMAIFIVLTGGIGSRSSIILSNYCRLSVRLSVPGRCSAVKGSPCAA